MDLALTLAVAQDAAKAAGALILAHSGRISVEKTKEDLRDLVTKTDAECQQLIHSTMMAAFGDTHAFLGEEDVPPGASAASAAIAEKVSSPHPLWVVDPIDGTMNFISGVPFSCVSIGVAFEGKVRVAVIYDPHRGEMFTATLGGGAFLNGAPMRTASCSAMQDAVFGWGLHHARNVGKTMLRAADTFMDKVRGMRALGSAALMMAYVAAGRFAGFFEHELCAWDLAAGSLLVTEAGGTISDMRGEGYTLLTRDCLVTCNP